MKQKLTLALTIVVGFSFIIALVYLFSQSKKPAKLPILISSVPSHNSQNASVFNPLTLDFDEPILAAELTASSIPEDEWTIEQNGLTSITIKHALYLRVATPYILTLTKNNQVVATLAFTTTAEQNDPRYLQGIQKELDRDYPLVKYTPLETPLYRVVYAGPLALEITLKNLNLTSDEAIAEVKAWVKSKGGDAEAHHYTVAP